MKMKMLATVALSSVLAASLSFAESADDMLAANDTNDALQVASSGSSDNVGANDSQSTPNNTNTPGMNAGGASDSSADTATGDDDY